MLAEHKTYMKNNTDDTVIALNNAYQQWKKEPKTSSKYAHFDRMVEECFGIKLIKFNDHPSGWTYKELKIVNQEMYSMFLFKYL